MKKFTANAEQSAWLTQHFGAVRRFSFTEGHETASFSPELKISDGKFARPIRGYGHEGYDSASDLFGFASQIKVGEYFVQEGKRVDRDPQIFDTNVAAFRAA